MKLNLLTVGALATSIFLASCGGTETNAEESTSHNEESTEETVEEMTPEAMSYHVATEGSVVNWTGNALAGAYAHSGTLNVSEGSLELTDGNISGGNFTIDMTSMKATDDNFSEEKTSEMLIGHLSTGDFFLVDSFPKAMFAITKVDGSTLMGDLTIRNKTNAATITDVTTEEVDGSVTATGKLVFDRQDFDVAYDSGKKDFVISNEIATEITLVAKK